MKTVPALTSIGARRRPLPPLPIEHDRLAALFEIQSRLGQGEAIEESCDDVVAIVARTLRVRTAVLLHAEPSFGRGALWAAPTIGSSALTPAYAHAFAALEYLGRDGAAASLGSVRVGVLAGGQAAPGLVPPHFVTLPLVKERAVIGVFLLEGVSPFVERDLLFVNVVASELAVALDRHRGQMALEQSRARLAHATRRLEEVHSIADAALSCDTLAEALPAMLTLLTGMFGADFAAVLLVEPGGRTLRRRASVGLEATAGEVVTTIGAGAAGRIALGASAAAFADIAELDGVHPSLRASGVRSLLGAPMRARRRLIGVLHVATRDLRAFGPAEHRLLEMVADRVGAVIESVDQHERMLAAIHSRDVVLGVVAHDLRNPLATIQMCLEVIPTDHPQLARPHAMIQRAVDVMQRLISDLRDVGSIEAGRLSIERRPEDACGLIEDVVSSLREGISRRVQRLTVRLPPAPLWVTLDRVRIAQVLTNLLTNASKFTPPGGAIAIAVRETATDVVFSVEDDGPGIAASDLPRVFERFWQARDTAHLGTGLGLAISRGIVEAHGGTISVASGPDGGSTFTFTLPIVAGRGG